jgi:hypothetical protein
MELQNRVQEVIPMRKKAYGTTRVNDVDLERLIRGKDSLAVKAICGRHGFKSRVSEFTAEPFPGEESHTVRVEDTSPFEEHKELLDAREPSRPLTKHHYDHIPPNLFHDTCSQP